MSYILNSASTFRTDMIRGFVAAYPHRVVQVPGGVVRATDSPRGEVAIITGGGSGHYPAFAGLVGPGLAHGAALGDVFASPSAEHVYQVARAAENGGGVLLTYGNYAGDVLNFDEAERRLRAEGIRCRTVAVSDDISSAPLSRRAERRGIAGDLCVFKTAAFVAEQGGTLDEVWEAASRANERTQTLGVAFTGCTLPGAAGPLFTVPPGVMAVGMGLHGEPGLREEPLGTAQEIAHLLVSALLAEAPESFGKADAGRGARVAVLTNGLGSVKYEELFVLHGAIDALLRDAGLTVVEPDVGEMCTSFEMAGVSLTLFWLDDALEEAWLAPADAPAYRKGSVLEREQREVVVLDGASASATSNDATQESRAAAQVAARAVVAAAERIDECADELGRIDAVAGDGDHGVGMQRGATAARSAALQAAEEMVGAGTVLNRAGAAWADAAGGASGALWGLILRTVGAVLGNEDAPTAGVVAAAAAEAARAVMESGKAKPGDKTMVDAMVPFADALVSATGKGAPLTDAWGHAADVARRAADATADLVPRLGRSRTHGEKSLGTPDPGALSFALIVGAIGATLQQELNDPVDPHEHAKEASA